MQRTFKIVAIWDDEAKVFYSESDIKGFHIETKTVDQFEELITELAIELIIENHIGPEAIAAKPMRDLVPAILWQRPDNTKNFAMA